MINLYEMGERIKKIRLETLGFSLFEFGSMLSEGDKPISRTTIDNYETGESLMNLKRVNRLSELSGVSIDYIVKGKERVTSPVLQNELSTQHFLDHIEELGFIAEDHGDAISIYVPGSDNSVKYLIAWVNKKESNNYRLLSILHPHKEALSDVIHIYSKTTKGQRGNKHKRIDSRQQDVYYNIK